jgi:hypothetical protein
MGGMNSDRLRLAAQKIRGTAETAAYGQWHKVGDLPVFAGEDAAHIALWSPPVAMAVADWLDADANRLDQIQPIYASDPDFPRQTFAVANLILGKVAAPA